MSALRAQVRGEWRKLRTVRSVWAIAGLGLTAELVLRTVSAVIVPADAGPGDVAFALRPSILFAVLVALLPLLTASAEWRWRTAVSTYALQPRRPVVLLAKVVVGGGAGLALAVLLQGASLAIGLTVLRARGIPVPAADTLLALTAGPVAAALALGAAAVALGTVVREQAAAVTVAALVLFVAPLPLLLLGPRWYAVTPAAWLDAVSGLHVANPDLPATPVAALLWIALATGGPALAAWRLRRTDVA